MASWTRVPQDLARRHPLYGIKGWAVVLAVALALAPARIAFTALANVPHDAMVGQHPGVASLMLLENAALVLFALGTIVLLLGLLNRKRWFRPAYTVYAAVAAAWPFVDAMVISAAARADGPAALDVLTAEALLGSAGLMIGMAYANLSQRIRVTCESTVRFGGAKLDSEWI